MTSRSLKGSRPSDNRLLKTALLKAFLLRCEILGRFGLFGKMSWQGRREARSYWCGVRSVLTQSGSELSSDADFAALSMADDPFVLAGELHRELCSAVHAGVVQ